MRQTLTNFALAGIVALGLSTAASTAGASALAAGASAAGAVKTVEAAESAVVKVDHRKHRRNWRHHRRPRGGIYFEFGTGGYRYRPPYYAPRYVAPPVYVRPRYVAPRPLYRLSSAHVRWCYDRYRSYRASDNTFQPYHGPRRQCRSPHMR